MYYSDTATVTKLQIHWTLYECELSWLWTLLLHVPVSWFHGHSSILDTVFHVNLVKLNTVTSCTYITVTKILLYDTLISFSSLTYTQINYLTGYRHFRYFIIVIWILCTQLYHVHTSLLYRFTCIHVLIVSIFLLHGSLFLLRCLLLHGYSCIPVTWLTNIDMIFLLLDMWAVDMRCVELSATWI